jgi:hypothetical protein
MKKKYCVIGLFHKEAFFIPYWQNYYGNLFGFENLYVFGDLKNDIFMKLFSRKVNKIEFGAQYHKHYQYHVSTIISAQIQLLDFYETVIFAEADQFIAPRLDIYSDLKDFLDKNDDDYFTFQGWNVIADLDNEPPINPTKSLLSQRNYWHYEPTESKTCVIRKPINSYSPGFHYANPSTEPHPELFNIHMHELDFEVQNTRVFLRNDVALPTFPESETGGTQKFVGPDDIPWPHDYSLIQDNWLWHWHKTRFYTKSEPHSFWSKNIGPVEMIPDYFKNSGII